MAGKGLPAKAYWRDEPIEGSMIYVSLLMC